MKLGVNQANTVVHIHRTGKTDDGISTCALFPAVTISFGIHLSLSFSLSLSLAFFVFFLSLSLSISLCLSFLWQISLQQCHVLEGLFSDNLSDNLAITICCSRPLAKP